MRTVSSLSEARAALASGERELISPPYAACYAGVGYYQALVETLRQEFGDFRFTLCCGQDAAIAHDALRVGFTHILCDCGDGQFVELAGIAEAMGAEVKRPNMLDAVAKAAKPKRN